MTWEFVIYSILVPLVFALIRIAFGWGKSRAKVHYDAIVETQIQTVYGAVPQLKAWAVYYSPLGGCEAAIIAAIKKAKTDITCMGYEFTSLPIALAMVEAKTRGVSIQVVLDPQESKWSQMPLLVKNNIPVWIDRRHRIQHNKVIILDHKVVITGSFNFTTSAEHYNAENLLVLNDSTLAAQYLTNFELHRGHSVLSK